MAEGGNLRFLGDTGIEDKEPTKEHHVIQGVEAEKIMFFFTEEINEEEEKSQLKIDRRENPTEIRICGRMKDKHISDAFMQRMTLASDKLEHKVIHGNGEHVLEHVRRVIQMYRLKTKVLPIQSEKNKIVRIYSLNKQDLIIVENAYEDPKNILAEHPFSPAVASEKQRSFKAKTEEEKIGSFNRIESDVKYQFSTKEGLLIKLYKKPITRLNVDAIVNAANDRLANIGGVAEVIEKAAGQRLKRECETIIRKQHKISDGLNVVTVAGDLNYNGVIHAVGPRWYDYTEKSRCLKVLSTTIFNILDTAEFERYRTVAMPPISSGIFGVPKDMCAAMYLKGIFEFSEQKKFESLQEFHIIDINDEVLEMVENWHKKFQDNPKCLDVDSVCRLTGQDGNRFSGSYGKGDNKGRYRPESASRFSGSRKGYDQRDIKNDHDKNDVKYAHDTRDVKYNHDGHARIVNKDKDKFILKFDKTDIHIYKADVLKLRNIDVIAVSEDPEISGKGALSTVLLDAGDVKYRSEHKSLRKYLGRTYSTGEVLMTTSGENFSFHHVLHAVIRRQGVDTERMFQIRLHETFRKILEKAHQLGYPNKETKRKRGIRLALPLIGVGTHKDKETILECALTAYKAISQFILKTKDVNINGIHLIDNNENVIKILQDVFLPSGAGRRPPPTPKPDFTKQQKEQYDAPKGKKVNVWKMIIQDTKKADPSEFMKSRSKQAKTGNLVIHGDDGPSVGDESCVICLCEVDDPVELTKCNHVFCKECITEVFRSKPSCPVCTTVYGVVFGDQPREGKATVYEEEDPLPSFKEKTYAIYYEFESGVQQDFHPMPKTPYEGMKRRAFLPKTKEGTEVLELLEKAFKQGLTFTIGTSRTTGKEGVITWNDIHHKTSRKGGPEKFGYPDPGYLSRVKEELACKGITSDT